MHTAAPDRPITGPEPPAGYRPGSRDLTIAAGLARGHTYPEIAPHLDLTPSALKTYGARLAHRLGAGTRAGLVGTAYRLGWLAHLRPEPRPVLTLTPRESEYLQAAATGLTISQIARRMNVACHTAKGQNTQVLRRLDARALHHAVALGYQHGHLTLPGDHRG